MRLDGILSAVHRPPDSADFCHRSRMAMGSGMAMGASVAGNARWPT